MKLFSTFSWVIPIAPIIKIKNDKNITFLPIKSDRSAKYLGKGILCSNFKFGLILFKFICIIGNRINALIKEIIIPILIIHPKFITGKRPEKTKDEKPTIVVATVYKQGRAIDETVFINRSFCDKSWFKEYNSLYLTVR